MTLYHWRSLACEMDGRHNELDSAPLLSCRQWCREGNASLALASFYSSSKLTPNWGKSIITEGNRDGGYPNADPGKFG